MLQPWGSGCSLDLRYRAWSKSLKASLNSLDQSIIRNVIVQVSFKQDAGNLIDAIHDLGNPFLEDSGDLITLDTKDIMEQYSNASVKNAYMLGQEQYALFVQERFEEQQKTISNPLKKN